LLAGVCVQWFGLLLSVTLILAANVSAAVYKLVLKRQGIQAAFYTSYFGIPEAYIHFGVSAASFTLQVLSAPEQSGRQYFHFHNEEVLAAACLCPLLQNAISIAGVKLFPRLFLTGLEVRVWDRVKSGLLVAVLAPLTIHLVSSQLGAGEQRDGTSLTARFSALWAPLVALGLALDWPGHSSHRP
jgi:hypothetical protein